MQFKWAKPPVDCEDILQPATSHKYQSELLNPTGPLLARSVSDLAVNIEQSRSLPVLLHCMERLSRRCHLIIMCGSSVYFK
jgi:hypothetical protein